ncbi:MAG: hypothetical protein EBU90_03900 [Proteobacteria bacterium]|nr:hypothetical protein [Pseudomonadota bacterium]NBP14213.1 hypothetical protein [bacterium]
MNPQPPEYVGNVIAGIVILILIVCSIYKYFTIEAMIPSDLITIGYIEKDNTVFNNYISCEHRTMLNPKLALDCIDALVILGHKKSTAKKLVTSFFQTNTVNSVEEFLQQIFKK